MQDRLEPSEGTIPESETPGQQRATATTPLFLHRQTYRRRRIMDAARLLPFFGTALLLLPALWESSHSTGMGAVYLFLAWLALIIAGAVIAQRLSEPLREKESAEEEER